jgi:hypothetical protein
MYWGFAQAIPERDSIRSAKKQTSDPTCYSWRTTRVCLGEYRELIDVGYHEICVYIV